MGAAVKPINGRTRATRNSPRKREFKSPIDKAKGYEVVWAQVNAVFDAAREFADPCFVYLIGETGGGPLKIGVSKDPISRLRTMQTGNPRRLLIEHVLVGDQPLEKLLHEFWEPFAIVSARNTGKANVAPGTEWFKPDARETLLPIIEDAASRQVEILAGMADTGVSMAVLEDAVRDAHAESGFVAKGRDEVRLLGATVGYSVARPSRI
jgi:hypothetical protein